MTDRAASIRDLILAPSILTLAVTVLRLLGELQDRSPSLFSKAAGGGGALIGISWLRSASSSWHSRSFRRLPSSSC